MKKNIVYVLMVSLSFILLACGSNSKSNKSLSDFLEKELFSVKASSLTIDTLSFSTSVPFIKLESKEVIVEFSNFSLELFGCELDGVVLFSPNPLVLDGAKDSQRSLSLSGKVKNDCTPTGYKITGEQKISLENESSTTSGKILLSVTLDANGDPTTPVDPLTPIVDGNFSFFNIPSAIVVDTADKVYDFRLQLIDNLLKGVPAKTVEILAYDITFGEITQMKVLTDSNGFANFIYTSPNNINSLDTSSLPLTVVFDDNGTRIDSAIITLTFNETTDTVDGNVSLPIVVIQSDQKEIVLDSNSKTIDIALKVFKEIAPYAQGSVKVELPEKVLNGVDVGSFVAYEVAVNTQGIVNFIYTGPSNLRALISNDDNNSLFKFFHTENISNKQEMKMLYELPIDPHISRNYALEVITSGDFSMGIPENEKTFNVVLNATDSLGSEISLTDENITKITVETTNSAIAQISDTINSIMVNSLDINPANNSAFILISKTLSGLVPLRVTVEFKDVNGDARVLTTIINVRVFSGPASAISISYVGTAQDTQRAKYIETLAISVTDEFSNRVDTRPNISLGAVVGYTVDGSEVNGNETSATKRLFYGRSDIAVGDANGEIVALGANRANFEDNTPSQSSVFKYVNSEGNNTDKLVVFGERKNYEAMGKWDIIKIDDNTLSLHDDYFGIDRNGLYYAVGHNFYQDQCREDGREWIGTTDSETYQLDEEGTVTVRYKYDYHLTGKDALIWVNLDGIQPDTGKITRVGEAVKHTLRGTGFTKAPSDGFTLLEGTSGYGTFIIWHENAPERYRNANFAYAIESGSSCAARVVARSNWSDARTCDTRVAVDTDSNVSTPSALFGTTDGTSYITFFLQAPADEDCTFNITDITVSSEF